MMEKDKAWEGSGECWREKALWRYLNSDLKELRALGQSRPGYGKSWALRRSVSGLLGERQGAQCVSQGTVMWGLRAVAWSSPFILCEVVY